jgi:hypothetical protein
MHHLGVQPRVRRQHAMEYAAVRIRPIHHRRDGQAEMFRLDGGRNRHHREL